MIQICFFQMISSEIKYKKTNRSRPIDIKSLIIIFFDLNSPAIEYDLQLKVIRFKNMD